MRTLVVLAFLFVTLGLAQNWYHTLDGGTSGEDAANAVAVTPAGGVVIAGSLRNGSYRHAFAAAYTHSGERLWLFEHDPFPGFHSSGSEVVATPNGGALVVCACTDSSGIQVVSVVAVSPTGTLVRETRYSHPDHVYDSPRAAKLDPNGNWLVLISSQTLSSGYDFAVLKFDSAAVLQWVTRVDVMQGDNHCESMDVDSFGNCIVAGYVNIFDATVGSMAKLTNSGDTLWTRLLAVHSEEVHLSDVVAANGVVSGVGYITSGTARVLVAAYSGTGDSLWSDDHFVGSAAAGDYLDTLGIVSCGSADESTTFFDAKTVLYSFSGQRRWVSRFDGPAHIDDYAAAIACDRTRRRVYVTGSSWGLSTRGDCLLLCYGADGQLLWSDLFSGDGGTDWDEGRALTVDADGCVYVVGQTTAAGTGGDALIIQYPSTGPAVNEDASKLPVAVACTVTPSVATTCCRFELQGSPSELTVVDARGRAVRHIRVGRSSSRRVVTWDLKDDDDLPVADGVYFAVQQAEPATTRTRVVVAR